MRSKLMLGLASAAVLVGATYSLAFATNSPSSQRSDCPGKIVCPITGDEVCRDRCPQVDAARTDCPGQVDCPVTGELVCRDNCPLDTAAAVNPKQAVRSCCRRDGCDSPTK